MPHGTTSTNDQNERWVKMIPDRVDWTVAAYNGAHIWQETDASGCFSPDCKVLFTLHRYFIDISLRKVL